jgi:steroid delta-isomerase-like uncharacterized protein
MGDQRKLAQILDSFWEHVNNRELDEAAALYAEDATLDLAGRKAAGRQAVKAEFSGFIAAFPDIKYSVLRRYYDGDVVVEEWKAEGTHGGEFLGTKPTGESISLSAVTIYEFRGSLIQDDRSYLDMTRVMVTTGVLSRNRSGG